MTGKCLKRMHCGEAESTMRRIPVSRPKAFKAGPQNEIIYLCTWFLLRTCRFRNTGLEPNVDVLVPNHDYFGKFGAETMFIWDHDENLRQTIIHARVIGNKFKNLHAILDSHPRRPAFQVFEPSDEWW